MASACCLTETVACNQENSRSCLKLSRGPLTHARSSTVLDSSWTLSAAPPARRLGCRVPSKHASSAPCLDQKLFRPISLAYTCTLMCRVLRHATVLEIRWLLFCRSAFEPRYRLTSKHKQVTVVSSLSLVCGSEISPMIAQRMRTFYAESIAEITPTFANHPIVSSSPTGYRG